MVGPFPRVKERQKKKKPTKSKKGGKKTWEWFGVIVGGGGEYNIWGKGEAREVAKANTPMGKNGTEKPWGRGRSAIREGLSGKHKHTKGKQKVSQTKGGGRKTNSRSKSTVRGKKSACGNKREYYGGPDIPQRENRSTKKGKGKG